MDASVATRITQCPSQDGPGPRSSVFYSSVLLKQNGRTQKMPCRELDTKTLYFMWRTTTSTSPARHVRLKIKKEEVSAL